MAQEINNGLNIFSELREIKAEYERVCDENATLKADLEELSRVKDTLYRIRDENKQDYEDACDENATLRAELKEEVEGRRKFAHKLIEEIERLKLELEEANKRVETLDKLVGW